VSMKAEVFMKEDGCPPEKYRVACIVRTYTFLKLKRNVVARSKRDVLEPDCKMCESCVNAPYNCPRGKNVSHFP
jgi:hypothetical protein